MIIPTNLSSTIGISVSSKMGDSLFILLFFVYASSGFSVFVFVLGFFVFSSLRLCVIFCVCFYLFIYCPLFSFLKFSIVLCDVYLYKQLIPIKYPHFLFWWSLLCAKTGWSKGLWEIFFSFYFI